ncbi:hypothetical protein GF336_03220 [Candidatus Woesearchaeota archaeon]|nr:hypothetical protein [Candidatus Woesearchaeota archaeon]
MEILERLVRYSEGSEKFLRRCNSMNCRMGKRFSWEPSNGLSHIYDLLKKMDISKKQSFCELGAGDARISLLTELLFGLNTTAIEYNRDTYEITKKRIEKDFPESKISLIHEDYENIDFSDYDVFYNYPWLSEEAQDIAEKVKKNNDALIMFHGGYRGGIEIMQEKGYSLKAESEDKNTRIYSSG